ncbi:Nramp family divalent metal transporter [Muricauda sp. SCSIO 64092]|uniref:Nramp family divalent metal transporter n=1 Tax=Allomuricauda sp. SCSIO 64092 TaxID=2908842 RepID=UPI001FF31A24|nr:Nramp family divalent metal transporter [Muricauda sp. SCSIO 64092]UOY06752.1 Nramp family divalent metal transporter [Muricauda sp. SCSIO 64092]
MHCWESVIFCGEKNHFLKRIGPGVLIAAAFIGPGTITACTLAGVSFGYALLWAMLFSVLATMVLQEMAARLGVVTRMGLADAIRDQLQIKWIRVAVIGIILSAILIGNAAYEAGNIGGAVLGLEAIFDKGNNSYFALIIGGIAFLLLWLGNYKMLEKVFIFLIALMSLSFLITAVLTKPNLLGLAKGLFVPSIPEDGLLTIIALIGTTIVPYNLFLHASLVNEKWKKQSDVKMARSDTVISIGLGGLVSMSIIVAAAAIPLQEVTMATDLAKGLEPLFGNMARYFMGIGLFAAGITSSITAPLAAAYVANSCFDWNAGLKDARFRMVWITILLVGVATLLFNFKPIEVITFAQVANGVLLPIIAILLVWIVNKGQVMGSYKNSVPQNFYGIVIIGICLVLGLKSIVKVLGLF